MFVPSGHLQTTWPPLLKSQESFQVVPLYANADGFHNEMFSLHKLYFDVVHKVLIPRKEWKSKASYFDLTLMEMLDTDVLINLPSLILKHMQCVLIQDKNEHALPYGFWLSQIF